ncbi:MAG: MXAN_5187 C-terminal domain-containing protein [Bradymonadia bacterium]
MFRIKVAATLFTISAVVGGVLYFQTIEKGEEQAKAAMTERLTQARNALEKVRQLQDFALVAKAEEVARFVPIGKTLNLRPQDFVREDGTLPSDDEFLLEVHNRMHTEVHVWSRKFEQRAANAPSDADGAVLALYRREKPDLFMVLNTNGVGVAKDGDPAWYGTKEASVAREYPILSQRKGKTFKDLWQWKGAPMDVAVSPIRFGGKVVGSVVLGYRLTGAEARKDKEVVHADVAYFVGEHLRQGSTLDSSAEAAVARQVVKGMDVQSRIEDGQAFTFTLGNRTWQGMAGHLGSNAGAEKAGFLVMANLDKAIIAATSHAPMVPLTVMLAAFVIFGLIAFFHHQFVKPLESIDGGVLEIINGNLDYWFEVDGDSKELADTMGQNLNIMVCHLSGRPLPEDEDEPPRPVKRLQWQGEGASKPAPATPQAPQSGPVSSERSPVPAMASQFTDPVTPVPLADQSGLSSEILALVNEPEESYLRRVYQEYLNASQEAGAPVKGISFQKFADQLNSHADDLKGRYNCSRIRFLVNIREQGVSLRPVPIA